jgi:sulfatase maturation enzyme AslB (radical SAM superfamily)
MDERSKRLTIVTKGESLVELDLLDQIFDYILFKSILNKFKVTFTIITNFNYPNVPKLINFLNKFKTKIGNLVISFDGSPLSNDINKVYSDGTGSTSHLLVALKNIKHEFSMNYVITDNNLSYVNESLVWQTTNISNKINLLIDNNMKINFKFLFALRKKLKEYYKFMKIKNLKAYLQYSIAEETNEDEYAHHSKNLLIDVHGLHRSTVINTINRIYSSFYNTKIPKKLIDKRKYLFYTIYLKLMHKYTTLLKDGKYERYSR